jgi:hypothetical protein
MSKSKGQLNQIHGRSRRQDESVSKKVLDIDRRFIDAFSAFNRALDTENERYAENAELDHDFY